MIQPIPQEISPLEIRHLTKFVEEYPEVIELLVNVWNNATWSSKNPAPISSSLGKQS